MSEPVLDSSALLALLLGEPGSDRVATVLPGPLLSAVNAAEIVTKLAERGMPGPAARVAIETTGVTIVASDMEQACLAGELRPATRGAGLSLGDRACLALARLHDRRAMTADTAWTRLKGFDIELIRPARPGT